MTADAGIEKELGHVAGLAELGVTWTIVPFERESSPGSLESIAAFGEQAIAKVR